MSTHNLLLKEVGCHLGDARAAVEDEHAPRELRRLQPEVRVAHEEAGNAGRIERLPLHIPAVIGLDRPTAG